MRPAYDLRPSPPVPPSPRQHRLHLRQIQRPVQHQPPVLGLHLLAQQRALRRLRRQLLGGGDAAREKVHAAQRGCDREEGLEQRKRGGAEVAQQAAAVEEQADGVVGVGW